MTPPGPWRLRCVAEAASTSSDLIAAAQGGEPDGAALLAERQTGGRGRDGRPWRSLGGNLHLSVLLRPATPAAQLPLWGLLAGVALAEAAATRAPGIALRWPNDLLRDGAKAGGVLVEAATGPDGALAWLVIGFGANLAEAPALPDRPTAALGAVAPAAFAAVLLERLAAWRGRALAEGLAPVLEAWRGFGPALGAPLTLRDGRSGRFAGLAPDGRLLLEAGGRIDALAVAEIGA